MATDGALPNDPELLQQLVLELREQLAKLLREKKGLEHELQKLARQLFGRRSERIDPNQLDLPELEALLGSAAAHATEDDDQAPVPEPTPRGRRQKRSRKQRLEDLPRERIEHPLAEEDRRCSCCDEDRRIFRYEVSEQLEYRPSVFLVIEHARPVAVCSNGCDAAPVIAHKPEQPIEKGLPGPGLLAHVAVSKYADHLPLNRLERIFRRQGVSVSRSTMCGWIAEIATRAGPVVEHLRRDLLRSHIIATDDTTVPVLERRASQTKKGRLWVYLGDEEHPWVVFDYTPTREGEGPRQFLEDYEGYLQADAYSGYDQLFVAGKVVEVGCWMHARRYFYEAAQTDPGLPAEALAFIRQLFLIERKLEDLSVEKRKEQRATRSKPLLDEFRRWLERTAPGALPKSPLGAAVGYTMRQWKALSRYAETGDLPIDNGRSERALRTVAVGRKNWMFAGSDEGARRAATIYSLLATCRRLEIDSFAYLRDLLQRLPTHPPDDIAALTPLAWREQQRTDIARTA
jgi:transposase